jgi:hypothetical protein
MISQQSGDHDQSSNRNNHLSSTGLDNIHDQLPLGVSFHHQSQQMANTTSNNISTPNNHQQQASALNIPKVIASNIDRATFRQQPPPMKVIFRICNSDVGKRVNDPGRLF